MKPEYGTGGQPRPRKDMNPLQLSPFEPDGDDQRLAMSFRVGAGLIS
jgi:hypothetical protein